MKTEIYLLCSLLNCGYLDVNFIIDLIDNNNLEIDLDEIISNWLIHDNWINCNLVIYELIEKIAYEFINKYELKIKKYLWLKSKENLIDYIQEIDMFEIYTNYIDSHLWFKNDNIQTLFDKSDYRV